jgi:hypothetical protein
LDASRCGPRKEVIELVDLPREAEFELTGANDTGIFFRTVDIGFEGGKPGPGHHLYKESGITKLDTGLFSGLNIVDNIKVTEGKPKSRRL